MSKVRRFLRKSGEERNYLYNYSEALMEKGGFVECDKNGVPINLIRNPMTDQNRATGISMNPVSRQSASDLSEIAALRAQVEKLMAMMAKGASTTKAPIAAPAPAEADKAQDKASGTAVEINFDDMTKAEIVELAKERFGDAADHMKDYMPKATLIESFGLLEAAEGVPEGAA